MSLEDVGNPDPLGELLEFPCGDNERFLVEALL